MGLASSKAHELRAIIHPELAFHRINRSTMHWVPINRTLSGYGRGDDFDSHQEKTKIAKDQCYVEEIKSWSLLIDLMSYVLI